MYKDENNMLEQELRNIWSNASQTDRISINTKQLIEELQTKVNSMQKQIKNRDRREVFASVIGIITFGFLLYEIPFLVTKLACVFSIIWFVYVILKFRRSEQQNQKTDLSLTMTEQLETQKAFMQTQVRLLTSSAYWYAIPPFIINFVFIVGLGNPTDHDWTNSIAENILPLSTYSKIGTLVGLTFFYSFIVWLNRRVVTKEINPLLENIDSMLHSFKNE